MKGLVSVKGSWGMGGGLRGVASFSLSWDSVSIPSPCFPRALPRFGRSFERALALPGRCFWARRRCFYGSARALHDFGYGFSCFVRDGSCAFAVGDDQEDRTSFLNPTRAAAQLLPKLAAAEHHNLIGALCPTCGATDGIHSLRYN